MMRIRALALVLASGWSAVALAQSTPPEGSAQIVDATSPPPAAPVAAPHDAPPAPSDEEATRTSRPRPAGHHHGRRQEPEAEGAQGTDVLWFGPEVGIAYVNLKMVSYDQLLPAEVDVVETGLGFGAAAGLRLKILSVGLHLAVGRFTAFDVWALNLDAQLRVPLGIVEPYVRLSLGYAFLGAFSGQVDMSGVTVDGWDAQAGFGLDLYPVRFFSIGAGIDFTLLNLTRTDSITSVDLLQDGAAVGIAVWGQAKAALHF